MIYVSYFSKSDAQLPQAYRLPAKILYIKANSIPRSMYPIEDLCRFIPFLDNKSLLTTMKLMGKEAYFENI